MRRNIRQVELAELLGYEQSYISALEVGIKGPPTPELIERLRAVLSLTLEEQDALAAAFEASDRRLVLDADAPQDVYLLLKDLRSSLKLLSPIQVRLMRDVLSLCGSVPSGFVEPVSRLKRGKRRSKE